MMLEKTTFLKVPSTLRRAQFMKKWPAKSLLVYVLVSVFVIIKF